MQPLQKLEHALPKRTSPLNGQTLLSSANTRKLENDFTCPSEIQDLFRRKVPAAGQAARGRVQWCSKGVETCRREEEERRLEEVGWLPVVGRAAGWYVGRGRSQTGYTRAWRWKEMGAEDCKERGF